MSKNTESPDFPMRTCDCPKIVQILDKACLKEKLEEWLDKRDIFDLFYESGFDIIEISEKYDKFEFDQDLLLFAIRNLFIRKFRDKIKNSKTITLQNELNECCLIKASNYRFDGFGVLWKPQKGNNSTQSNSGVKFNDGSLISYNSFQNDLENIQNAGNISDLLTPMNRLTKNSKDLSVNSNLFLSQVIETVNNKILELSDCSNNSENHYDLENIKNIILRILN